MNGLGPSTAATAPATTGAPDPDPSTLHHPRILCLHGGGTNASIFHRQCRAISHALRAQFRLVYAEAEFPSVPGPDVLTVFAECGPFKRWLVTTGPNAMEEQPRETWASIERQVGAAMDADDALGATGPWVAVLGFSQGGRVAASILLRQQERPEAMGRLRRRRRMMSGVEEGFRFGVIMAGRGPLLQYDPDEASWLGKDERFDYASNVAAGRVLRIPTIHVHGHRDPGLGYHQILLEEWCDPKSTTLIEWDGDHRLPIRTPDVKPVVDKIRELAAGSGVKLSS